MEETAGPLDIREDQNIWRWRFDIDRNDDRAVGNWKL
jgi:hypothetical protein